MKFEVFKPMELATDLPKDVAESYGTIASRLQHAGSPLATAAFV